MSNFHWDDINVKVDDSCPIATSDISVNLKNRQKAIDTAGYGPLNPTKPNNEFWDAKAERWNVAADDARDQKCGNCAAFIQTKRMLDCIDKGLGNESGNSAWDVINAGDLGYCEAFDFKCASSRTCDTWIVGGPIIEEKENNMEEKSLEDMYSELLAIEEKSLEDTYLELLAIEEKAGLMVPVRPDIEGLRLRKPKFEKRLRPRPPLPGPGPGGMGRGRYKAEEEDEPEEDMLYDEEYVGDDEDDKAMMRPGGAGSPRDASDRQRGQQFMNWASGRNPSGTNVHPTSVGNMDIGDSGRRNVANSRMTDLMRNRSWTNPSPRPRVRPERGPGNPGPAPRPRYNMNPPNPPIPNTDGRKKPKDWGSDNAAQQISGGIPQKSAWDEEAYYEYEYDFDMKKLPMGDGGGKRPSPPSPKRNEENPNRKFQQFADHLNANDVGGPGKASVAASRQAGLKKYVGDVAIGAAGSASSSPVGDNRGTSKRYAARVTPPRPVRGPGNPGAPKPRPTRGPGNPGPKVNQQRGLAAAGDYFSGRSGDPRANAQQQATRGRERISKFGRDVIGDGSSLPGADRKGPQPKPGKLNRVTPSKRREDPPRKRPLAFNQAVPRQNKPSQGGLERAMRRQDKPSQGGLNRAMRRQNKPSQSLLGENFSKSYDQGYEYDGYEDYLYQKSYDQGYDEYDEYEDYLYQKSYDQGYDEYDEYEDYIDFKGMTSEQAAGLRAAGEYFGDKDKGKERIAGFNRTLASGYAGLTHNPQKPNTSVGGGRGLNPGNPGPNKRPNTGMSNKPNRPIRPTRDAAPRAPRPKINTPRPGAKKPSSGGGGGFYGETFGSRWNRFTDAVSGKGSDEEMYWDDEDEMAIPPDTDDKAEYTDTQRAEFRKFGDHLNARDIADGPQRAAEAAKRQAGLKKYVGNVALGAAGSASSSPVGDTGRVAPRPVGGGRGNTPGRPLVAPRTPGRRPAPMPVPNRTMPITPGRRPAPMPVPNRTPNPRRYV
jgi:hypothetical protein